MKAIILNGIDDTIYDYQRFEDILDNKLQEFGIDPENVKLTNKDIKRCRGCFGCWVKSPGECIRQDDSQAICKSIINSDLVILLTPVVYGGYSSQLKKLVDKIIPLISPFFARYSGETHHFPRYKKYPKLLGIGIQSYPDIEESACFQNIIFRNSINFHNPKVAAQTILIDDDNQDVNMVVSNLLKSLL